MNSLAYNVPDFTTQKLISISTKPKDYGQRVTFICNPTSKLFKNEISETDIFERRAESKLQVLNTSEELIKEIVNEISTNASNM